MADIAWIEYCTTTDLSQWIEKYANRPLTEDELNEELGSGFPKLLASSINTKFLLEHLPCLGEFNDYIPGNQF
jgi:hypothetical protein